MRTFSADRVGSEVAHDGAADIGHRNNQPIEWAAEADRADADRPDGAQRAIHEDWNCHAIDSQFILLIVCTEP